MESKVKFERYQKYKDSGVEWLGEIPEHWEVKKIKYLAKIKTGYTPSTTNSNNFSEDGVIWAKPDNLNEFIPIIDSKEKVSIDSLRNNSYIPKGSILVCCIGTIGKLGVAGCNLITNQQINSIIFNNKIEQNFGKYLIFISQEEHENK